MPEDSKDARKKYSDSGKIHNADEFAEYVHAVSIPMKVVMFAIVVFFVGVIAYCIFGRVPIAVDAAAVVDSTGTCTCYVKSDKRDGLEPGDPVEISDGVYQVSSISSEATCVDEEIEEYTRKTGNLEVGDYVYLVTVDVSLNPGVYSASLIKDYLQPLAVLLAG